MVGRAANMAGSLCLGKVGKKAEPNPFFPLPLPSLMRQVHFKKNGGWARPVFQSQVLNHQPAPQPNIPVPMPH